MSKWKLRVFGLASAMVGYAFGCGCPGVPCGFSCKDLSVGAVGDLIQDVLFGVMFD